jgi:hypothetical protein
MLMAAQFWAEARNLGRPTSKDDSLDADVILAGQAAALAEDGQKPVIATTNVKHLSRVTQASLWHDVG